MTSQRKEKIKSLVNKYAVVRKKTRTRRIKEIDTTIAL